MKKIHNLNIETVQDQDYQQTILDSQQTKISNFPSTTNLQIQSPTNINESEMFQSPNNFTKRPSKLKNIYLNKQLLRQDSNNQQTTYSECSEANTPNTAKHLSNPNSLLTKQKDKRRFSLLGQLVNKFDRNKSQVVNNQTISVVTMQDIKEFDQQVKEQTNQVKKEIKSLKRRVPNLNNLKSKDKWIRVRNHILTVYRMGLIMKDIKQYGTNNESEDSVNEHFLKKAQEVMEMTTIKKKKDPRFFYIEDDFLAIYWCLVQTLLYLIISIIFPYMTFFDGHQQMRLGYYIFCKIIDAIIIVDIVIFILTVRTDSELRYIFSIKVNINNYIKKYFILDVLSVFPFELLYLGINSENHKIQPEYINLTLKICKLPILFKRILKGQVFQDNNKNTAVSRTIKFLINSLLATHICACVWYFVSKIYDHEEGTWVNELNLQYSDNSRIYVVSQYWAISTLTTVGFGDIRGFNNLERIVCFMWMLFGVGIYSYVIGALSQLVIDQDTRSAQLAQNTFIMDEFCKETGLSKALKKRIRKAMQYNSLKSIVTQTEKDVFFESLPPPLKVELANNVLQGSIKNFLPFLGTIADDSNFIADFLKCLQPQKMLRGEYVYKKGQIPNYIFFIMRGRVNFVIGSKEICFKCFVKGSYFGELEIFHDKNQRMFTVRCEQECDFLSIDKYQYIKLMKQFPNIRRKMLNMAIIRGNLFYQSIQKIAHFNHIGANHQFWEQQQAPKLNFQNFVNERKHSLRFLGQQNGLIKQNLNDVVYQKQKQVQHLQDREFQADIKSSFFSQKQRSFSDSSVSPVQSGNIQFQKSLVNEMQVVEQGGSSEGSSCNNDSIMEDSLENQKSNNNIKSQKTIKINSQKNIKVESQKEIQNDKINNMVQTKINRKNSNSSSTSSIFLSQSNTDNGNKELKDKNNNNKNVQNNINNNTKYRNKSTLLSSNQSETQKDLQQIKIQSQQDKRNTTIPNQHFSINILPAESPKNAKNVEKDEKKQQKKNNQKQKKLIKDFDNEENIQDEKHSLNSLTPSSSHSSSNTSRSLSNISASKNISKKSSQFIRMSMANIQNKKSVYYGQNILVNDIDFGNKYEDQSNLLNDLKSLHQDQEEPQAPIRKKSNISLDFTSSVQKINKKTSKKKFNIDDNLNNQENLDLNIKTKKKKNNNKLSLNKEQKSLNKKKKREKKQVVLETMQQEQAKFNQKIENMENKFSKLTTMMGLIQQNLEIIKSKEEIRQRQKTDKFQMLAQQQIKTKSRRQIVSQNHLDQNTLNDIDEDFQSIIHQSQQDL